MSNDLEVPRRGYDTKDVEAMNRALYAAEAGGNRKGVVMLALVAVVAVGIWLIV